MIPPYDSVSAIESSARQSIWMACDSKTFKDEVAEMEDSYIARICHRWEELFKLFEFEKRWA